MIEKIRLLFEQMGSPAIVILQTPRAGEEVDNGMGVDFIAIKRMFWDLIIFHPDCTFMAVSGNRWYGKGMSGYDKRVAAIQWTKDTWKNIEKHSKASALENPVSVIFSEPEFKHPQYIQPWQFGHGETKRTGFYLRNLPLLQPTSERGLPRVGLLCIS